MGDTNIFKVLADPQRREILLLLREGRLNAGEIAQRTGIAPNALSYHLKLLKTCGLITSRREGKEVYYRAADNRQADALHHMIEEIAQLSCPR